MGRGAAANKTGQSRRLPGGFRELKVLLEKSIRILDEKKTDEDRTRDLITYDHRNAEATTQKGLPGDGGREPEPC